MLLVRDADQILDHHTAPHSLFFHDSSDSNWDSLMHTVTPCDSWMKPNDSHRINHNTLSAVSHVS
jgi:hypothetical protein